MDDNPRNLRLGSTPSQSGLTLAEILVAVGFLAVFVTSLLAIAIHSLKFSRQQTDVAAAYLVGEAKMEEMALLADQENGWNEIVTVSEPQFPEIVRDFQPVSFDSRFVYTVTVQDLASDLKFVEVVVYRADQRQASGVAPKAAIDVVSPRRGEMLRFTNLYARSRYQERDEP